MCLLLIAALLGAGCGGGGGGGTGTVAGAADGGAWRVLAVAETAGGAFQYPAAVAVDSAGAVYVADSRANRIRKLGSDGATVAAWGSAGVGPGQLDRPAVDVDVDHRKPVAPGEIQQVAAVLEHALGLVGRHRGRGHLEVEVVALHVHRDDHGTAGIDGQERLHPLLVRRPVAELHGRLHDSIILGHPRGRCNRPYGFTPC